MSLQWVRISGFAIQADGYTVWRQTRAGKHVFEAWYQQQFLGDSKDPDQATAVAQAKAICEEHVKKRAA